MSSEARSLSGKHFVPTSSEQILDQLANAQDILASEGVKTTIIPVSIEYERMFDMRNLVTKVAGMETYNFTFLELLKRFNTSGSNEYGRVFVKLG